MNNNFFLKEKKILYILQRNNAFKQFPIVEKLYQSGAKISTIAFKKTTEKYVSTQSKVQFQGILKHSYIEENAKEIVEKNNYTFENFREDYGITSFWKHVSSLRRKVLSYKKKYPYAFEQNNSDEEIEDYILAFGFELKNFFYKFKPDLCIGYIFGTIEFLMLEKLCNKEKIPYYNNSDTKVDNISAFFYDTNHTKSFFHHRIKDLNIKNKVSKNRPKAEAYISNYLIKSKDKNYTLTNLLTEPSNLDRKIFNIHDIKSLFRNIYHIFKMGKFDKSKIDGSDHMDIRHCFRDYFYKQKNIFDVSRMKFDDLNKIEDFVYLPLGLYPETTLSMLNNVYDNQINTARVLARFLPNNLKLVVKDHPYAFGRNSKSFLLKLQKSPNVKLINYKIPNSYIYQKMKCLISFAGTSIFESCIYKKPAIQIGSLGIMRDLPNFYQLHDIYKIENLILEIEKKFEEYSESEDYRNKLLNYISAAYDTGYFINMYESKINEIEKNRDYVWNVHLSEIKKIFKYKKNFCFK